MSDTLRSLFSGSKKKYTDPQLKVRKGKYYKCTKCGFESDAIYSFDVGATREDEWSPCYRCLAGYFRYSVGEMHENPDNY